jgi:hypothetical protein
MLSAIKKYWYLPTGLLLCDADYLLMEYERQTLNIHEFWPLQADERPSLEKQEIQNN